LKFVGRQAGQKAAGFRFHGLISTRNKGGYQGISHGRSPVGEEAYQTLWPVPYYCESRNRLQGG
jgi:hypothetical protein